MRTRAHAGSVASARSAALIAIAVVAVCATGPVSLLAQTPADALINPATTPVFVRGGWLFDGVADDVVRNPGILIRNGMILSIGGPPPTQADVQVVDLQDDDYLLPGLFDLHAHYAIDLFGEGRVDAYEVYPVIFLANGVTSTFPAGEVDPEGMLAARRRIDAGQAVGPRIHNSGPYYGSARPGWDAEAMTPDSIAREVDYWAARGARGFKAKGIRPEQLNALIGAAHRNGLPVTGHLDSGARNSVNPLDAIAMGIDRIEHFIGGDATPPTRSAYASLEELTLPSAALNAAIDAYIAGGVYFDATVSAYGYWADREPIVYEDWADERSFFTPHARAVIEANLPRRPNDQFERIYQVKKQTVKAFYDRGGARLITLGTDHPSWGEFLSGFGSHRELHAFTLSGIPPADALRMGTINGANALNMGSKLGTIETGKYADMFVVRGNPLADIRNTRNVRLVMKGGALYDARQLLESVRGKLGPASAADDDWWKGRVRLTGAGS